MSQSCGSIIICIKLQRIGEKKVYIYFKNIYWCKKLSALWVTHRMLRWCKPSGCWYELSCLLVCNQCSLCSGARPICTAVCTGEQPGLWLDQVGLSFSGPSESKHTVNANAIEQNINISLLTVSKNFISHCFFIGMEYYLNCKDIGVKCFNIYKKRKVTHCLLTFECFQMCLSYLAHKMSTEDKTYIEASNQGWKIPE